MNTLTTVKRGLGFSLVLALGLVGSCGGNPAPQEDRPIPKGPWKDMNHDDRLVFMKKVVFPKMKPEFVAFDSKDFGDMTCVTCHGDGAKDKTFKMPNPKLPKLPATEEGFKKLQEKHPEAVKFMREKVVPDMASLLGEEPYNRETHKGFGCFECHVKED
jgi:hypothetical protein